MKPKRKSAATDLKTFLERAAAKKKRSELENVPHPCNESHMQMVVFQWPAVTGTSIIAQVEPPIAQVDESESSDANNDDYDLQHDPGLRAPISSYRINGQDSVRRAYIAMGRCQPSMKVQDFPQHNCGGMRRFQPKWFDEFKWIEYSVQKDVAYCFVCYLFKDSCNCAGGDAFVDEGFRNWNMKDRIRRHVGAINSAHNQAEEKYRLFISLRHQSVNPLHQTLQSTRLSI